MLSEYQKQLSLIRNGMAEKTTKAKERRPLKKVSEKRAAEMKAEKEKGGDSPLDLWFEERRSEMTGRCSLCPNTSYKNNDERYRWSCHHLLDKRKKMFPSLALHHMNFLEVCHTCHQNIHGGKITFELLFDSKERDLILPKLRVLLPLCSAEERKTKMYSKLAALMYLVR